MTNLSHHAVQLGALERNILVTALYTLRRELFSQPALHASPSGQYLEQELNVLIDAFVGGTTR